MGHQPFELKVFPFQVFLAFGFIHRHRLVALPPILKDVFAGRDFACRLGRWSALLIAVSSLARFMSSFYSRSSVNDLSSSAR